MNYFTPMAFGMNFFAMTGLMIYLSLVGESSLAADIAIVQASTTALFYAFSGNARSLILNSSSEISAKNIVNIRALLFFPLGLIAAILSVYISNVMWLLAALLILRKGCEWFAEIYLSELEKENDLLASKNYAILQILILLSVFISIHVSNLLFFLSLAIWAITPLINCYAYLLKNINYKVLTSIKFIEFLPHLGSTAVIGISVYVFRLLMLSFVDKSTAGDLFAAFSIGGLFSSIFIHTIGPTIVGVKPLNKISTLLKFVNLTNFGLFIIGLVIAWLCWGRSDAVFIFGKSEFFVNAVGFSLIGGVLMFYSQYLRLRILQQYENTNVYGPDIIINILFIASTPFVYYIFGINSLPLLFLYSAVINFLFYCSYFYTVYKQSESFINFIPASYIKCFTFFLILLPVFMQISSCINYWCIFNSNATYYDTKGILLNLPIPVSVFACMFGLLVFNNYQNCRLTLTVILMYFVLMLLAAIVSTNSDIKLQQSKMILMMQFILPSFALIFGHQVYKSLTDLRLLSKTFLFILVILVPAQLIITWLEGQSTLMPNLYYFSFYQHLQYGPVIIISAYILLLFSLIEEPRFNWLVLMFMPIIGIYAMASASRLPIFLLILSVFILIWLLRRRDIIKNVLLSVIATSFLMAAYFPYALQHSYHYRDKIIGDRVEKLYNQNRLYYWNYYVNKIKQNNKILIFGERKKPDREKYPSAHNYYLDLVYNFGIFSLLPIFFLVIFTIKNIVRSREKILSSLPISGITIITIFIIFVDNFFKVGFRQPYPGIFSFFLWGMLIAILMSMKENTKYSN